MKAIPALSIIIPAYNEAEVITQTLDKLLEDQNLQHIHLIVVCNACTDRTAAVIQHFIVRNHDSLQQRWISISILETQIASKTNAINLGISHATSESVILLDADIQISGEALLHLVEKMFINQVLIASPRVFFNYQSSDFFVRHYYKIAEKSKYNTELRISNVIALSKTAVQRLTTLPSIIADDEFIRQQFLPQ